MSTTKIEQTLKNGVRTCFWEGLAAGESGDAAFVGDLAGLAVQVTGTFNTETLSVEGTIDGTNYVTLNDLQDGALDFTAAGMAAIQERPLHIRPTCSAGSGVDLNITISGVQI